MRCTIYIVCGKADIHVAEIVFIVVDLAQIKGYVRSQLSLVMLG
jgi:hypothetical protein